MNYGEKVANKIKGLIEEKGVKRTKLGEILGADENASAQWKYIKFQSFLKNINKSKINFEDLKKIATFFGKSVDWFLSDEKKIEGIIHIENKNIAVVPFLGNLNQAKKKWTDSDALDWISYPFGFDKEENIFAIKIENDCMYPRIKGGDIVFVNPSKKESANKIVVISWDKKILIRKLTGRFLECENKIFPDILLENNDDIEIIGIIEHKLSTVS